MTCFCELSHYAQMALIIITWLGVLAQLALPLYRFSYRRAVVHTVLDGVILFVLLALLCFLVRYNQHVTQSDFHLPVPALICILVAAFAYSVISLIAEMRRSKREINEWSVKEAIDDLPVGLLFADADGHIILINRKMAELSHLLIDRLPRTLSDMTDALSSPPSESQVEAMTDVAGCYRFRDDRTWEDRIYRFCRSELDGEGLYEKVDEAKQFIRDAKFRRTSPTVK